MILHTDISARDLLNEIKQGKISFAGNKNLKIYGILQCKSGKRMLKKNRVFFKSENEALKKGFRPCAHCMKTAYRAWMAKTKN